MTTLSCHRRERGVVAAISVSYTTPDRFLVRDVPGKIGQQLRMVL